MPPRAGYGRAVLAPLDNDSDACDAERKLAALKIGQERAFSAKRDGSSVFASCSIYHALPDDAVLQVDSSAQSIPFFDLLYAPGQGGKSGMHHPDGILWIRHPARTHAVHQERVPLLSVAPTILDLLGIDKPEYMKGESLFRMQPGCASPARTPILRPISSAAPPDRGSLASVLQAFTVALGMRRALNLQKKCWIVVP